MTGNFFIITMLFFRGWKSLLLRPRPQPPARRELPIVGFVWSSVSVASSYNAVALGGGGGGGGTKQEQRMAVYMYNIYVCASQKSWGGTCPLCPPGSYAYAT